MLTRRSLLFAATALGALPLLPASSRADDTAQAAQFINQLLKTLVGIVNGGGSAADKRNALAGIVDKDVDVAGVAQFCLGRYWRTATPDQQRTYVELFHRVLVNNITSKIGDYQGVAFEMGRALPREDAISVSTTVTRPNNQPNKVDWIVTMPGGSPKIIDVIAEGTSLRLTQRSDYAAYLSRNNNSVQALIDAMRKQADQAPS
jgi:phospholipid transport system substrate-binding protein